MSQVNATSPLKNGLVARIGVLVLGVIVCGLLFFADKTNLENDIEAGLTGPAAAAASATSTSRPDIPPFNANEAVSALQLQLQGSEGEAKVAVLDSLIALLTENGRPDAAAFYALDAAELDASPDRIATAGILAQKATSLPHVGSNPELSSFFGKEALDKLISVKETASQKEDVLLHLGLAYIGSGVPENSMQGILTIRSVLELNPDNIEASYQLGNFSLQTNQFDKAQARFEKVLSIDDTRQDARLGLATALINLEQPAEARELLQTVVTDAKNNELRLQAGAMLENIR